jgi:hypothetical protein
MKDGSWLDKYEQGGLVLKQKTHDNYGKKPNANYPEVTLPPGFVGQGYNIKGRNYSPAWGGQFQNGGNLMPPMAGADQTVPMYAMGGSLPGAVGFTYARVSGAAPANGPYAKKTKASAQNGQEMSFYQHGLDWKPKNISRNGNWLDKFEEGGEIIKDNEGYWNPENWGKPVEIGSNEITMEGVLEPLLGVSDTGDTQMMYPGKNYTFSGTKVVEYPREYFQELGVAKDGKSVNRADEYPLEKLDNLLNFTNYNKPQKAKSGKWLDKYQ